MPSEDSAEYGDDTDRLFTDSDRETLDRALDAWGAGTQEDHAVEELGELLTAIMQYRRGRVDQSDVRDEIADALIVVNQLAIMYGVGDVEAQIEYKMSCLEGRVGRAEALESGSSE